ncbi:ABC transporter ATP-binding protein [Allofustis seminis]|uniref:ABC transporter ATP-binding protein n=1 Tax=Allofustis seminis TaxID=166939 RepID=UPI000373EF95|nr:ABC transporter ATP-binding protein [Allofustis seminis]
MSFIEVKNVARYFGEGARKVVANENMNFTIKEGDFCVIVGPSGAGKTTMLNLLGGMDRPSAGHILIDGVDIAEFDDLKRTTYRRNDIGFIFQNYNLIPNLTAKENVEMAAELSNDSLSATQVLTAVGLAHRLDNFPAQLSGGEQQRVAIARGLVKRPKLLLCDEPTGALDFKTGIRVLDILKQANIDYHMTVVVITHNREIAKMADRIIEISNATVRNIQLQEHPVPVTDLSW